MNRSKLVGYAKMFLLNAVLISAMGAATLYVWNAIVPVFVGGPPVNFIQALAVLLLIRVGVEIRRSLERRKPAVRPGEAWRQKLRDKSGVGMAGSEKDAFEPEEDQAASPLRGAVGGQAAGQAASPLRGAVGGQAAGQAASPLRGAVGGQAASPIPSDGLEAH